MVFRETRGSLPRALDYYAQLSLVYDKHTTVRRAVPRKRDVGNTTRKSDRPKRTFMASAITTTDQGQHRRHVFYCTVCLPFEIGQ